jgi:hypothetical protein
MTSTSRKKATSTKKATSRRRKKAGNKSEKMDQAQWRIVPMSTECSSKHFGSMTALALVEVDDVDIDGSYPESTHESFASQTFETNAKQVPSFIAKQNAADAARKNSAVASVAAASVAADCAKVIGKLTWVKAAPVVVVKKQQPKQPKFVPAQEEDVDFVTFEAAPKAVAHKAEIVVAPKPKGRKRGTVLVIEPLSVSAVSNANAEKAARAPVKRSAPPATRSALCKSVVVGGICPHGDRCRFAHSAAELNPTICSNDEDCNKFPKCTYKHSFETIEEYMNRRDLVIVTRKASPKSVAPKKFAPFTPAAAPAPLTGGWAKAVVTKTVAPKVDEAKTKALSAIRTISLRIANEEAVKVEAVKVEAVKVEEVKVEEVKVEETKKKIYKAAVVKNSSEYKARFGPKSTAPTKKRKAKVTQVSVPTTEREIKVALMLEADRLRISLPELMAKKEMASEVEIKVEEIKVEEIKVEEIKVEEIKVEEIKVEEIKVEEIKVEEIKAEKLKKEKVKAEKKVKKEKVKAEKVEAEKVKAEKVKAEKVKAEKVKAEKVEAEKVEAEKVKAERVKAEAVEAEKVKAERVKAEKVKAERVKAEKVEAERVKAEALKAERVKAEKVKAEKVKAEKVKAEKVEAEKVKAEKVKAEKVKAEKVKAEKVKAEKVCKPEDYLLVELVSKKEEIVERKTKGKKTKGKKTKAIVEPEVSLHPKTVVAPWAYKMLEEVEVEEVEEVEAVKVEEVKVEEVKVEVEVEEDWCTVKTNTKTKKTFYEKECIRKQQRREFFNRRDADTARAEEDKKSAGIKDKAPHLTKSEKLFARSMR